MFQYRLIIGSTNPVYSGETYSRYEIRVRIYRRVSVYILKVLPPICELNIHRRWSISSPFILTQHLFWSLIESFGFSAYNNLCLVIAIALSGMVLLLDPEALDTRVATGKEREIYSGTIIQKEHWISEQVAIHPSAIHSFIHYSILPPPITIPLIFGFNSGWCSSSRGK